MDDFRADAQTDHAIHKTPKQIWLIFKNEKNEIIDFMPTSFGGVVYGQFVPSPVVYARRLKIVFSKTKIYCIISLVLFSHSNIKISLLIQSPSFNNIILDIF